MGNCMKSGMRRQEEEEIKEEEEETRRKLCFVNEISDDEFCKSKSGLKVKIVLTKQELEWLMLQLEDKQGMKLEDALGEIGKGRTKVETWKPSLESIIECPEVLEIDR